MRWDDGLGGGSRCDGGWWMRHHGSAGGVPRYSSPGFVGLGDELECGNRWAAAEVARKRKDDATAARLVMGRGGRRGAAARADATREDAGSRGCTEEERRSAGRVCTEMAMRQDGNSVRQNVEQLA
ncbi:hypothetical protein E2562_036647 [Oryza meyeriana var. granulata]|uniref:DUF834 domain-containing protein n=1 Tax=Oryza meyeriana var. granulata TaxID=110450 RepID=A0A6G1DBI8_9ORYZ|nr:hypothetical protein E2562_036647 [Oryza meyeriana var. granulata]